MPTEAEPAASEPWAKSAPNRRLSGQPSAKAVPRPVGSIELSTSSDPTLAGRKRIQYAKTAAMVGRPLVLLAGLLVVWQRRRAAQPKRAAFTMALLDYPR